MFIEDLTIKHFWKGWGRLKKKGRVGQGIDGLSVDDISDPSGFITGLFQDVQEGQYKPDPVREAVIHERGKSRKIGIVTLRDYVVQGAVISLLQPHCESRFLDCSYAYRPGRSAMQAADVIAEAISSRRFQTVVESDFQGFFDMIDHEQLLRQALGFFPGKEDWLKRIFAITLQSELGLIQGAPVSPLYSNLFLHMFDQYFEQIAPFYLRYSDDFLLFTDSIEEGERLLDRVQDAAKQLQLSLKLDKTDVKPVSEGFDFLGHRFDLTGKRAGLKALSSLEQNLRAIIDAEQETDLFHIRIEQAVRGWEQYFGPVDWKQIHDRDVRLLSVHFHPGEADAADMNEASQSQDNEAVWRIQARVKLAMEQDDIPVCFFWLARLEEQDGKAAYEQYRTLNIEEMTFTHFSICMTYIRDFHNSRSPEDARGALLDWLLFEQYFETAQLLSVMEVIASQSEAPIRHERLEERMKTWFTADESRFGHDLYIKGIRRIREKKRGWTVTDLHDHVNGNVTLAQYLVNAEGQVPYAILDVDVLKPYVFTDKKTFEDAMNSAWKTTLMLYDESVKNGFHPLLEKSGQRGYHLWFFFQEPADVDRASGFLRELVRGVEYDERISVECFPKQLKWKKGMISQAIKIPGGLHPVSGNQSVFLDRDETPLDLEEALSSIRRIRLSDVAKWTERRAQDPITKRLPGKAQPLKPFAELQEKCPVMDYYVRKASKAKHLSHDERMFFLSLAGPLGEDGRTFIHQVMGHTSNYRQDVTDRYVNRAYDLPISCPKIREKYPEAVEQVPCHCRFQIRKGEYPTPLLYIERFRREVFHTDREPEAEEIDTELIEEKVRRLVELRKQKRGIERALEKTEQDLSNYMKKKGETSIELKFGELTAVTDENGRNQWVIRL